MITSLRQTGVSFAVCGLLLFGVAACGGGAEVRSEVSTTTTGQQFIDLKKALDAGAIDQKEYERERQKILEKR